MDFWNILWLFLTWNILPVSTLPHYSNLTMTLDVPFGKSVKLDFSDILRHVNVSANSNETIRNDRCQIRVLDKETIYAKVGLISSGTFPCTSNNVTYSHLGFESPSEDIVKFRLEYFTATDFIDYTLFLILKIGDRNENTFVRKGLPLRISEKSTESKSLPIVRKVILLHDEDFSLDFCTVEVVEHKFFPLYGKITKNGVGLSNNAKFNCQEFFNGELRYELTAEVFSSSDLLLFKINYFLGSDLEDAKNVSVWQSEYFQMPVQIEHADANAPPEIDFSATLLLDVSNFVIRSITREVLLAKDVDGASSGQLRIQVTQAPELSDGFLIRLDDPIHPIDSFTQKDVDTGKIAFRPPVANTQTDRLLEIVLEIADPQELTSQPVPLMVVIHPTSYYAPFVVINTGLTLYEGEAATLWDTKNLAVGDEDNLDEVGLRVVSGLAHGRLLLRGDSVKQFVPGDLQTGALRYQHDGSDSLLDGMVLQMDDGQHQVDFLLPITIRPVDDQPPVLLTNTGILVHSNKQIVNITSKILKAKDRDSESSLTRFVVKSSLTFGRFLLADETLVMSNAVIVTEWTQSDINAGRLFYQHDDAHSNGRTTWHTIQFMLEDNNAPVPNLSPHLQTLTITVIPLDTLPPHLSSAASMRLHVNASQVAIIGNGILHFVDDHTSDRDLSLIVRTGPQFGRLIWTSLFGGRNWPAAQAGSDDAYDVNLIERQIPEQFPQSALAYGDIAYQADNVLEDTKDKIVFDVRDKLGNVLKEQVLQISIHPHSDFAPHSNLQEIRPKSRRFSQQPPAVLTRPVIVKEGETAIINEDYLLISPSDQPLAAITLRLERTPQRGTLSLQNQTLALHDHFPATQISNGHVSYRHNNTTNQRTSLEDHVTFSLSEKSSKEPVEAKLHIRIIPQPSTKPPRKLGLTKLGLVLQVKRNTPYYLTAHTFIGSTNSQSPPSPDLIFHVEKSPQSGSIFLYHNHTFSFTWKDIQDGNVFYKAETDTEIEAAQNALFDDEVSFRIDSPTSEWVMNDKIIDHLEIQILLVPENPLTSVGKPFVVGEGQSALLSEEHLVIVAPPYQRVNCSLVNQPSHGHLIDTARNTSTARFSNYELLEHRIRYHQSHFKAVEPRSDSIRLNCAGAWVELPVTIQPANDEPPLFNANHLQVSSGEKVLLGAFVSISDADSPPSTTTINITRFPQHGVIIGRFTDFDPNEILIEPPFRPVRNFTMDDLLLPDRIFYHHDGTRTFSDNFTVIVSDGVNSVEREIFVVVHNTDNGPSEDAPHYGLTEYITAPFELVGTPQETVLFNATRNHIINFKTAEEPVVRDQMPNITFNSPNSALVLLPNKHLGAKLSSSILTVKRDKLSTEKELLFEVVEQPKYGHFVDLHKAERHIRVFTEELVNNSAIAYALDLDKEFATEDSFKFRAINELGKKSQVIEGSISWSWISFLKDRHETNEMTGLVRVGLRRRGNLKNRDFVAVKARDLTTVTGRDYKENFALQAEFQPGQNETSVEIRILKDDLFEDREYFQLLLEEPQFANVEKPFVTTITISDQDDGAMVYIPHPLYTVSEDVGVFNLTLKRSGKDLSQSVSVICYTTDGTASGTISHQQQIFRPDFGTRLNIHSSMVTFGPHETTKICPIIIVNDGLAENDETFYVNIRTLGSGSRVGVYQQTEIVIQRDPQDEPSVSFAKGEYSTSVFDPFVEIQVERKGGDLSQPSEVDIISEQRKRVDVVYFGPGESSQTTTLKRLGDFNVTNDMFKVYLNNSQYCKILQPNFATVHVKKSMNFTVVSTLGGEPQTPETEENEIFLLSKYDTPVEPSLLPGSETRYECINCDKNKIALDKIDFTSVERDEPSPDEIFAADVPSRKSSYGPFYRDERERILKKQKVEDWKDGMIDTAPNGRTTPERRIPIVRGGVIMKQGSTTGERARSASTISFAKAQYDITEPSSLHHMHWVSIPIIRYGDISKSDTVRVITKDGSAKAGQDFEAVDTIVNFEPNRSQEVLQVRVVFDESREPNENFTIQIYALRHTVADLKTSMTIVTIREQSGENVRFPGAPIVVNLANYDSPAAGGWVAIGQPVICITTCNPRHPDYQRTRRVCEIEGIDDTRTAYSWKISQLQDDSQVLEPLQHIRSTAWFASIYEKVLDSIYFSNGSIIQCSARAVTVAGLGGYESISEIVTSVSMKPQCPSKGPASSVTIDPFEASISNMKNGDVKITVKIPHRLGMVPLVSTAAITDLHLTLGGEGTRTAEHLCSNMLTEQELRSTRSGFLKLKADRQPDSRHPLEILRGPKTQEFYRHLDLKNCQWMFEAVYSMTEILNVCGGKLVANAKAQTSSKREVTIQLPLYVTNAYFTNAVGTPWKHYDQSTVLDIVISYDNVLTWSPDLSSIPVLPRFVKPENSFELSGPVSPRTVIHLQSAKTAQQTLTTTGAPKLPPRNYGRRTTLPPVAAPDTSYDNLPFPAELKVIQSRVVDDGHHMNVRFKTKPKFRGKYLLDSAKSRTGSPLAKVVLTSSPTTAFELQLLKTQENNANPQQLWRFRSVRANQIPYGGTYNITLLPCEFDAGSLTMCKIREPVTFVVHLDV